MWKFQEHDFFNVMRFFGVTIILFLLLLSVIFAFYKID